MVEENPEKQTEEKPQLTDSEIKVLLKTLAQISVSVQDASNIFIPLMNKLSKMLGQR